MDIEIKHLKKENLTGEPSEAPGRLVSPIHVDKSTKIPKMKDDYVWLVIFTIC